MDQQSFAGIPWQVALVAGGTALFVLWRLVTRPARRRRREAKWRALSPQRREEIRRQRRESVVRDAGGEAGDGGEL